MELTDTHMELATHLVAATAVLPIVSTLAFGAAMGPLLELNRSPPDSRTFSDWAELVQLSASAALSAYATAFALLEQYYGEYATATRSHIAVTAVSEDDSVRRQAALAADLHSMLRSFRQRRETARNAMWLGLVLLLVCPLVRMLGAAVQTPSLAARATGFFCCAMLVYGAVCVPRTVLSFRANYRPMITHHLGRDHEGEF